MAFAYFNRNIPDEAHQKMGEMGPAGVQAFAFTPSGGWVIVVNGGYFARGIPDECFSQLGTFIKNGHKIRVIAFPPEGGNRWLIVTDKTYFARNIPDECYERLGEMWKAGARPTCVAFPYPGGNRWVILAGKALYARGIDDECFQLLCNFAQGLRPAERVAFTRDGGWTILAEERYFARNIPEECYQQMGQFAKTLLVDHVNFAPNGGWSVLSNTAKPALPADRLRDFENRILQVNGAWKNIWERMAFHKVAGVSIATVANNSLAWATSYGRVEAGKNDWVHTDTVFQAASCSKPVSALGFLRLVQSRLIGLDENVNPKLGWTLPARACVQASWKTRVTLRRLLQHNGGIIGRGATNPTNQCSNFQAGGGGGFAGYENTSGVGIPTVTEILNGSSSRPGVSVNSHRIEQTYDPGSLPNGAYSGEGFVLMTQLFQNLRQQSLGDWMKTEIFTPAGMKHSTFSLTAPSFSGPPAAGHDGSGKVITGKRNRYPESAAAGLYTTPSDLCRYLIAVNQGGQIDGQVLLDSTRHTEMMNTSLGMPVSGVGTNDAAFWHNGGNRGFKCVFKGYPGRRAGFVIMTNAEAGDALYSEIQAALVRTYGWE